MLSFGVQDYVLERVYSKWKHESVVVFGKVAHATVAVGTDHSRDGEEKGGVVEGGKCEEGVDITIGGVSY